MIVLKTIKIAICDDENQYIDEIKEKIKRISENEIEVTSFSCTEDIKNNTQIFDAVILDVEINNENGMDLAEYFYNLNKDCLISIFSSYPQYAVDGYKYNVYRYILKQEPDVIKDLLISETISECKRRNFLLEIRYNNMQSYIKLQDIKFIESYGRLLTVHTLYADFLWNKPMYELLKEIRQYNFIQCHKSYIVNLAYISSIIKDRELLLKDGSTVPIGKKYKAELKQAIIKFR